MAAHSYSGRFLVCSETDSVTCSDIYPELDEPEQYKKVEHQYFFYCGCMDVRPDGKMFVHATRRGCILEIWKNNESSISPYVVKRFFKPNYISSNRDMKFPRVSENVDDPYGIFQLSCSNRYIYAIYDSEPNRRSSKIAVFDWKGNPQRLYIGNKDLLAIDVDNDNTVYALAINDDDNIELISIPL